MTLSLAIRQLLSYCVDEQGKMSTTECGQLRAIFIGGSVGQLPVGFGLGYSVCGYPENEQRTPTKPVFAVSEARTTFVWPTREDLAAWRATLLPRLVGIFSLEATRRTYPSY
jgi:hypothetical protein